MDTIVKLNGLGVEVIISSPYGVDVDKGLKHLGKFEKWLKKSGCLCRVSEVNSTVTITKPRRKKKP